MAIGARQRSPDIGSAVTTPAETNPGTVCCTRSSTLEKNTNCFSLVSYRSFSMIDANETSVGRVDCAARLIGSGHDLEAIRVSVAHGFEDGKGTEA